MNKFVLSLFLLLGTSSFCFAQNTETQKLYEQKPLWINMMDDTTANYFETIKAYETFWKKHEKPMDEEGELMTGEKEFDWSRIFFWRKNKQARELQEKNWLRYQCKRFEWWKKENLAYVQPDGRILTMQERARIFYQNQNK